MLIPFKIEKLYQASAVLLKTEPGYRMSRLRLLKLLYIADRESLKERARPVTGDRVVAMDHGPVLSTTYNLIRGRDPATPFWEQYLRSVSRDVELHNDPGVGELTRYEIAKLQDVAARFKDCNDWDVAEYTHDFEEWKKNQPAKGSSKTIPFEDVLEAVGRAHQKDELVAESKQMHVVSSLLSQAAEATGG